MFLFNAAHGAAVASQQKNRFVRFCDEAVFYCLLETPKALYSGRWLFAARVVLIFHVHRALAPYWLCAHPVRAMSSVKPT
ncbi:hypothetical protein [Paraburkholderia polaris]|uniref:hypothetical protein n=1 Tax=Paraburkholderia polaris TaxID=2728848 RepID=UPI00146AB3BF|nr:hypothetical protein [Paraburkholderia polaris]